MKTADFSFEFNSEKEARIIFEALKPEVKHKIPRVTANVAQRGKTISLKLQAIDTSAMRAACNSYLRWIQTAMEVEQSIS